MASGFITFENGYAFANRWTIYDHIIKAVIPTLEDNVEGNLLKDWLSTMIPPDDIEDRDDGTDMGWGFIRPMDGACIIRSIDIRSLHPTYKALFLQGLEKACAHHMIHGANKVIVAQYTALNKMIAASTEKNPVRGIFDTGEMEQDDEQIGPGWEK